METKNKMKTQKSDKHPVCFLFCLRLSGLLGILVPVAILGSTALAQIAGVEARSPPLTHALVDSGDVLVGVGLNYHKVENPRYQVEGVSPSRLVSTETFGFLAIGLMDWFAVGLSTNPTQFNVVGTRSVDGVSEKIDTNIVSSRSYYYLIPTLVKWNKNRLALIWGKGTATFMEHENLGIAESSYDVGTTGLIAEIFLIDSFSIIPWASWSYLLFDLSPPEINDMQTPDYGFEGVIHLAGLKISLTMIFTALDTVESASEDKPDESEENTVTGKTKHESYAVSFSYTF